eukprot:2692063-Rhodomonas_salina.1
MLQPGTYKGPFLVEQNISIRGHGDVVVQEDSGNSAALCICTSGTVSISGLKILTDSKADNHALYVLSGFVTVDECSLCGNHSPAVVACSSVAHLFLRNCDVSHGSAGGVLCTEASLRGLNIRVSGFAASGVEVREDGDLELVDSVIRDNNKSGVLVWCGARNAQISGCEITGHANCSGILCGAGKVEVYSCNMHNNKWGCSVQSGDATVVRCHSHQNVWMGLMVQSKGNMAAEENECNNNGMHGIFVGYDSLGKVTLCKNRLHSNKVNGIFNGVPKSRNVLLQSNQEWDNLLLPTPAAFKGLLTGLKTSGVDIKALMAEANTTKKSGKVGISLEIMKQALVDQHQDKGRGEH